MDETIIKMNYITIISLSDWIELELSSRGRKTSISLNDFSNFHGTNSKASPSPEASDKQETGARTLRPKINKLLKDRTGRIHSGTKRLWWYFSCFELYMHKCVRVFFLVFVFFFFLNIFSDFFFDIWIIWKRILLLISCSFLGFRKFRLFAFLRSFWRSFQHWRGIWKEPLWSPKATCHSRHSWAVGLQSLLVPVGCWRPWRLKKLPLLALVAKLWKKTALVSCLNTTYYELRHDLTGTQMQLQQLQRTNSTLHIGPHSHVASSHWWAWQSRLARFFKDKGWSWNRVYWLNRCTIYYNIGIYRPIDGRYSGSWTCWIGVPLLSMIGPLSRRWNVDSQQVWSIGSWNSYCQHVSRCFINNHHKCWTFQFSPLWSVCVAAFFRDESTTGWPFFKATQLKNQIKAGEETPRVVLRLVRSSGLQAKFHELDLNKDRAGWRAGWLDLSCSKSPSSEQPRMAPWVSKNSPPSCAAAWPRFIKTRIFMGTKVAELSKVAGDKSWKVPRSVLQADQGRCQGALQDRTFFGWHRGYCHRLVDPLPISIFWWKTWRLTGVHEHIPNMYLIHVFLQTPWYHFFLIVAGKDQPSTIPTTLNTYFQQFFADFGYLPGEKDTIKV